MVRMQRSFLAARIVLFMSAALQAEYVCERDTGTCKMYNVRNCFDDLIRFQYAIGNNMKLLAVCMRKLEETINNFYNTVKLSQDEVFG